MPESAVLLLAALVSAVSRLLAQTPSPEADALVTQMNGYLEDIGG